jgi:hypothetical protein
MLIAENRTRNRIGMARYFTLLSPEGRIFVRVGIWVHFLHEPSWPLCYYGNDRMLNYTLQQLWYVLICATRQNSPHVWWRILTHMAILKKQCKSRSLVIQGRYMQTAAHTVSSTQLNDGRTAGWKQTFETITKTKLEYVCQIVPLPWKATQPPLDILGLPQSLRQI